MINKNQLKLIEITPEMQKLRKDQAKDKQDIKIQEYPKLTKLGLNNTKISIIFNRPILDSIKNILLS